MIKQYQPFRKLKNFIGEWKEKIASLFPRELTTSTGSTIKISRFVDISHARLSLEGRNVIGEGTKISGDVHLGYATTISSGSNLFGKISVGRYCQFGPNVAIYAINHPVSNLASYTGRRLFEGRLKKEQKIGQVVIGHDVWIGHGAVILRNVTIGNGAIIGAGAIVTHDVDEFMIAVGNPARSIRKRFGEDVIDAIKRLKWWDRPPELLERMEELFHIDINENPGQFIEQVEEFIKND
jgi:virginiamycin A acetyltransferase